MNVLHTNFSRFLLLTISSIYNVILITYLHLLQPCVHCTTKYDLFLIAFRTHNVTSALPMIHLRRKTLYTHSSTIQRVFVVVFVVFRIYIYILTASAAACSQIYRQLIETIFRYPQGANWMGNIEALNIIRSYQVDIVRSCTVTILNYCSMLVRCWRRQRQWLAIIIIIR